MFKTVLLTGSVIALMACSTLPSTFPPEAHSIGAKALEERLAGNTYRAQMPSGVQWEMQFGTDGRMNMLTSRGADKGPWRAEDNRLCVEFEGSFPSGCSEIRAGSATRLYLKRASTGEVVVLDTAN